MIRHEGGTNCKAFVAYRKLNSGAEWLGFIVRTPKHYWEAVKYEICIMNLSDMISESIGRPFLLLYE